MRRYGFRRHYHALTPPVRVEIHCGRDYQAYVTPVAKDEVCLAVLSRDPRLRVADALGLFPDLAPRLAGAEPITTERGGLAETFRLNRVIRRHVALIGDASGAVDPISGAGLSMVFEQAEALSEAIAVGDLWLYERAHRRILRLPRLISGLIALLDGRPTVQRCALAALDSHHGIFAHLVAAHAGGVR
jgi:menaquinone-9 beta-reductase